MGDFFAETGDRCSANFPEAAASSRTVSSSKIGFFLEAFLADPVVGEFLGTSDLAEADLAEGFRPAAFSLD